MSPRLSYNLQRDFSIKVSIFGYAAIVTILLSAIIGTVLTKGRIPSSELVFRSDMASADYNCNGTVLYPGQTFGSFTDNSTFTYTTMNSFPYTAETLSNCQVKNMTTLDVIGPPIAWPRISYNHSIECNVGLNDQVRARFAVTSLNRGNGLDHHIGGGGNAVHIWDSTVEILHSYAIGDNICGGDPLLAFRVEDDTRRVVFPAQRRNFLCFGSFTDFQEMQILNQDIKDAMAADFAAGGPINILPNVLYPCSPNITVWASSWSIFWYTYTAAAATISPAIIMVIHVLRWLTGVDKEKDERDPVQEKMLIGDQSSTQTPTRGHQQSPTQTPTWGYYQSSPTQTPTWGYST